MKVLLFAVIMVALSLTGISQTATNFTANDCDGVSHDLYTELDQGKVIVLCWVMPCSSCIAAAKTSFNVVQSYQTTHPGRVFFYLADDYANTVCSSVNSWANANNIFASASSLRFSNSVIDMLDYGTTGMPKVVIMGCGSHHVIYNANSTVNSSAMQAAIDSALNCTSGVEEQANESFDIKVYPAPVKDVVTIEFYGNTIEPVTIAVVPVTGTETALIEKTDIFPVGKNLVSFNLASMADGMYLVRMTRGSHTTVKKFTIVH